MGIDPEMIGVSSGETEKWTGAMNVYELESTRFGVCFEKVGRCWDSRLVKLDRFWCIY